MMADGSVGWELSLLRGRRWKRISIINYKGGVVLRQMEEQSRRNCKLALHHLPISLGMMNTNTYCLFVPERIKYSPPYKLRDRRDRGKYESCRPDQQQPRQLDSRQPMLTSKCISVHTARIPQP
jgi:hypothetical protein